ncbi:hypothetical protein MHYP_G00088300 [Metynnis hypsauchen]
MWLHVLLLYSMVQGSSAAGHISFLLHVLLRVSESGCPLAVSYRRITQTTAAGKAGGAQFSDCSGLTEEDGGTYSCWINQNQYRIFKLTIKESSRNTHQSGSDIVLGLGVFIGLLVIAILALIFFCKWRHRRTEGSVSTNTERGTQNTADGVFGNDLPPIPNNISMGQALEVTGPPGLVWSPVHGAGMDSICLRPFSEMIHGHKQIVVSCLDDGKGDPVCPKLLFPMGYQSGGTQVESVMAAAPRSSLTSRISATATTRFCPTQIAPHQPPHAPIPTLFYRGKATPANTRVAYQAVAPPACGTTTPCATRESQCTAPSQWTHEVLHRSILVSTPPADSCVLKKGSASTSWAQQSS